MRSQNIETNKDKTQYLINGWSVPVTPSSNNNYTENGTVYSDNVYSHAAFGFKRLKSASTSARK